MSINQNKPTNNNFFMNLALMQAKKVIGNTNQNPAVGCVITKKNVLISAASTSLSGRPHAEHNALNFLKENPNNSNIYVTLEPCSHYGKTPPCTKKIIKGKIKKVFFSIYDPDQRSYNRSKEKLNKKNIAVITGTCCKNIKKFYKSYLNYKSNNLPFVTAKIAVSKDFFLKNKRKKWITNKFSRGRVHLMRSQHDCILTSAKTIGEDNPMFTCRINGLEKQTPSRIILDKKLKISPKSNVIRMGRMFKTFIFYNNGSKNKIQQLRKFNIRLIKMQLHDNENFDLKEVLIRIKNFGFSRIFIESGLNLISNFLKKKLINNFELFISNEKARKDGVYSFKRNMIAYFKRKKSFTNKINLFGDKLITYNFK